MRGIGYRFCFQFDIAFDVFVEGSKIECKVLGRLFLETTNVGEAHSERLGPFEYTVSNENVELVLKTSLILVLDRPVCETAQRLFKGADALMCG
jgi:hypothetical protein